MDYGDKHSRRACHQTWRDLAGERGACLPNSGRQEAMLLLLHVLPPVDEMENAWHSYRDGFGGCARAAHNGRGNRRRVRRRGRAGGDSWQPIIEILATASERDARLIVLTATHRSGLENLTRDRTVYRVLAHARCPVLTLREGGTEIRKALSRSEKSYCTTKSLRRVYSGFPWCRGEPLTSSGFLLKKSHPARLRTPRELENRSR